MLNILRSAGGNIIKNFAQHGAGVWTQSTFTMTGGLISLNEAIDPNQRYNPAEAEANGGGVWVNDKSVFQMKGGQISLNKADLADPQATFEIKGADQLVVQVGKRKL